MAMQSEPLKTGFEVREVDGVPSDLPVRLRFPNGSITRTLSNELDVDFIGGSLPNTYIRLDLGNIPTSPTSSGLAVNGNTLELWWNGSIVQSWTVTPAPVVDNSHILGINLSLGGLF